MLQTQRAPCGKTRKNWQNLAWRGWRGLLLPPCFISAPKFGFKPFRRVQWQREPIPVAALCKSTVLEASASGKGLSSGKESRSRERRPTTGPLLKCSPSRHQLNSQGLGGSISRQRFCYPGFRSNPVPVPGGDGRSALWDPSSGCPHPTSAGKIIIFWLSRSSFFSSFTNKMNY